MYHAVLSMWRSSKRNVDKIYCYRGGRVVKEELELYLNNIGKLVQNLGFLSASLSEVESLKFVKNAYF